MQVFLDPEQNYSVERYAGRTSKSIGPIYLNLDWGPEYESQSANANAAIRSIGRKEAFDAALRATRGALAPLPDRRAFDIQAVSEAVLAGLGLSGSMCPMASTCSREAGACPICCRPRAAPVTRTPGFC